MLTGQALLYFIYAVAAASVILAGEAFYLSLTSRRSRFAAVNYRLRRLADEAPAEKTLKSLLRERGLTESGDFVFGFVWLNRLYTQSGITGNPLIFAAVFLLAGLAIALTLTLLFGFSVVAALIAFLIVGLALPLVVLRRARNKRIEKFAKQLPDALDMIVRSLRAGHPASVAIGLVAREMADPLGTEFGIVADEI
ncbi:MAG: type II secretion system protein F, partial [Mesorhizobium sp.]